MAKVKNIMFDLGGVIMTIDQLSAVRRFKEIGLKDAEKRLDTYTQSGIFGDLEEGKISASDFIRELGLMLACRNGEVDWQNRERIHQKMEFFVYLLRHLFLRTVLVAKETRALAQGFLIYLGARTYDTGWVPLQFQLVGELAGFYVLEVAEAVAGICPHLQLAVEET